MHAVSTVTTYEIKERNKYLIIGVTWQQNKYYLHVKNIRDCTTTLWTVNIKINKHEYKYYKKMQIYYNMMLPFKIMYDNSKYYYYSTNIPINNNILINNSNKLQVKQIHGTLKAVVKIK